MSNRHLWQRRLLAGMLLVFGLLPGRSMAQDKPVPGGMANEASPTEDAPSESAGATTDERKQNLVSILWMLLGGVGILGVAMVGMALIWGSHARRLARHTDHRPTQQDEFWYLRTPPPPPEDSAMGSSTSEEGEPQDPERETER